MFIKGARDEVYVNTSKSSAKIFPQIYREITRRKALKHRRY